MPTIWLCSGFGWLKRPRRDRALPGTMSYISGDFGVVNTIRYSDSMPAQPIEIKQLVQSVHLTPTTGLRCRQPGALNPINLRKPFISLDLRSPCRPSTLPLSSNRKLVDTTPQPECFGYSEYPQSGMWDASLEA